MECFAKMNERKVAMKGVVASAACGAVARVVRALQFAATTANDSYSLALEPSFKFVKPLIPSGHFMEHELKKNR